MSGEKKIIDMLDSMFPEHTDLQKYVEFLYLCFAGVENGLFYAVPTEQEGGFVLVASENATTDQLTKRMSTTDFNILIGRLIAHAKAGQK